jgi:hypothetical protein
MGTRTRLPDLRATWQTRAEAEAARAETRRVKPDRAGDQGQLEVASPEGAIGGLPLRTSIPGAILIFAMGGVSCFAIGSMQSASVSIGADAFAPVRRRSRFQIMRM